MPEQSPKPSKIGRFAVLRSKSSDTNISVHAGSAQPSCFGTGHMTFLSTPPWKEEYAGVLQHRCSSVFDFCLE